METGSLDVQKNERQSDGRQICQLKLKMRDNGKRPSLNALQESEKVEPPFLSWFSLSLNSVERRCKILGCSGEGSEGEDLFSEVTP